MKLNGKGVVMRKLSVEIPATDYDKLTALADEQDITMSQLVRRVVRARVEHIAS